MRDRPFRPADPGPPPPRKCRACGLPLEFIYDQRGKLVAVQRVTVVYLVGRSVKGSRLLIRQNSLAGEAIRIPHSGSCPREGKVSRKQRQKPHE